MNEYIESASRFFENKFEEFGESPKGVDWSTAESQDVRLKVLLKIIDYTLNGISIADIGCGYGRAVDLMQKTSDIKYFGYEIVESFVLNNRSKFSGMESVQFSKIDSIQEISTHDFTIASGVFNKKFDLSDSDFLDYIKESLFSISSKSTRAFSVNFLSGYSDKDKRRDDLYYADPLHLFDFLKRNVSSHVSLIHDYGLWDFALLVQKEL